MTDNDFRKIALQIPGAVEKSHMNHPDFRVSYKIFASLGVPDKAWAMVKLTPEQQRLIMAKTPKMFKPCSGAWGKQGATNIYLPTAKPDMVRAVLDTAANNVVPKKKSKADQAPAGAEHRTSNIRQSGSAAV
jgi:YjbR protein